MSKERQYNSYVNQDGVLETLPKEQLTIDELTADQEEQEPNGANGDTNHLAQAIGARTLTESATKPTAE